MSSFFIVVMVLAMVSTVGALLIGVLSMIKGGEFDKKYSNKLMQARVIMQGVALASLVLAWFFAGHNS